MATNTYAMTGAGARVYSGGPHGGINPGNDAFAGGSRTPAGTPVGVGGQFSSVGATGGPPPSFGTPATAFARNNRGSNIRIPYARVVSLHNKDKLVVEDPGLTGTGHVDAYEYDGLEAAELAWIMSKQFSIKPSTGSPEFTPFGATEGFQAISTALDLTNFGQNLNRYLNSGIASAEGLKFTGGAPAFGARGADGALQLASSGLGGHGVNRMERMAYTRWVEAHFKNRVGRQVINLMGATVSQPRQLADGGNLMITDNYNPALDSEIDFWSTCWVDGATVSGPASAGCLFAMPDIAYMLQKVESGKPLEVAVPMMQGLYVMEKGPFLRSYGAEHEPVMLEVDTTAGARAGRNKMLHVEADRHVGSDLAQRALLCELKKAGMLNWTPDGICLSKEEVGPDPGSDAFFDARLGQLYNIGVQGPSITKTWSNDSDMLVMPMDKVFVLVVGQLSYETKAASDAGDLVAKAAALTKAYADARFTVGADGKVTTVKTADQFRGASAQLKTAMEAYQTAVTTNAQTKLTTDEGKTTLFATYEAAITAIRAAETPPSTANAEAITQLQNTATMAVKALETLVTGDYKLAVQGDEFKADAKALRNGTRHVSKAQLMHFRLMRATSSFLSNRSHFDADDTKSRCGLSIGYDGTKKGGNAEYILGGWCIGTVVDSAASRALGHNGIRSAPSSYAINVNVNVEWWNPDKLYSHYMDKERDAPGQAPQTQGTTFARTSNPFRDQVTVQQELKKSPAAAYAALREGTDDFEGLYKQPNPYGADTDATQAKQRTRAGAEIKGGDPRVWSAAKLVATGELI